MFIIEHKVNLNVQICIWREAWIEITRVAGSETFHFSLSWNGISEIIVYLDSLWFNAYMVKLKYGHMDHVNFPAIYFLSILIIKRDIFFFTTLKKMFHLSYVITVTHFKNTDLSYKHFFL